MDVGDIFWILVPMWKKSVHWRSKASPTSASNIRYQHRCNHATWSKIIPFADFQIVSLFKIHLRPLSIISKSPLFNDSRSFRLAYRWYFALFWLTWFTLEESRLNEEQRSLLVAIDKSHVSKWPLNDWLDHKMIAIADLKMTYLELSFQQAYMHRYFHAIII